MSTDNPEDPERTKKFAGVVSSRSDVSMGFVVGKSMEEGIGDVTPTPVLPPSVQDHIGLQLRRSYADLVKEPIPSRLLQLLDELEAKEKKS